MRALDGTPNPENPGLLQLLVILYQLIFPLKNRCLG